MFFNDNGNAPKKTIGGKTELAITNISFKGINELVDSKGGILEVAENSEAVAPHLPLVLQQQQPEHKQQQQQHSLQIKEEHQAHQENEKQQQSQNENQHQQDQEQKQQLQQKRQQQEQQQQAEDIDTKETHANRDDSARAPLSPFLPIKEDQLDIGKGKC